MDISLHIDLVIIAKYQNNNMNLNEHAVNMVKSLLSSSIDLVFFASKWAIIGPLERASKKRPLSIHLGPRCVLLVTVVIMIYQ